MSTKGDWLSKSHKSAELDKLKTLNYEYEKLIDANADVISREVRKIRKVWAAGSLHIGWSYSERDPKSELHLYDVACYNVGSFYVKKAPAGSFPEDLISALKKNVEMSEAVSLKETPASAVALSQGDLYLYVLIVPAYNTRNTVTRADILSSYKMIEHDLDGKKETGGCDVRIAASYYARQVADHVVEKMKNIATKEKWDVKGVKLKVGKSFLPDGLPSRWSTSYKGVYDKPMIPLVILKDGDLPDCLQDEEFAASCGRDDATVGDTRDEIAMRIEEAIARRGKLWGYDLDNDQRGDHPTPKKGGGDASVVYLVHRDLVSCAVRTIEKTKRATDEARAAVGGPLVPHLDEPSRIGRDVKEIARAIGGLLVYEDSELARKMGGLFIGDTEECKALKAENEDLKAANAKLAWKFNSD